MFGANRESQSDDEGREHPVARIRLSMTHSAEKKYTITELKCLAIIWCVRKLHCYLDGAKIIRETDHSALQWLFDFKGSNRRLIRWSYELQPYREFMTIKYCEGKKHANVDPLPRAPLAICNIVTVVPIVRPPGNTRLFILRDHHDAVTSGHLGIAKTVNSICRYLYWLNMTKDIREYVRSCMQCQHDKPAVKSCGPHQPLPTPAGR